jgi:hypothetical protein
LSANETAANQFVRDLVWAASSPPLLRPDDTAFIPTLDPAAIDREKLAAFLGERPERRVGHYFENLIHFWLEHIRRVEILAHRQQVWDGDRTVGELDFIFRDETGRLTHWEVAIKFYFLTKPSDGTQPQYLGPNTADSLERKIARMNDHQLPLSSRIYDNIDVRQAFVKGRIYHHPNSTGQPAGPAALDPDHLRGVWLHQDDVASFAETHRLEARNFAVLKKPFWLTPAVDRIAIDELEKFVETHFRESSNALHLAVFDRTDKEILRIFVVSNAWPA